MSLQIRYNHLLQDFANQKINKLQFLDELNNSFFGGDGLQVQIHNKDSICTKWRDWLSVRELDWWVQNVNHRSVASCELVLDAESQEEMQQANTKLEHLGIKPTWIFTGSRGFHAHLFSVDLAHFKVEQKKKILSFLGVDVAKASHRNMISIEMVEHWKTQQRGCLL